MDSSRAQELRKQAGQLIREFGREENKSRGLHSEITQSAFGTEPGHILLPPDEYQERGFGLTTFEVPVRYPIARFVLGYHHRNSIDEIYTFAELARRAGSLWKQVIPEVTNPRQGQRSGIWPIEWQYPDLIRIAPELKVSCFYKHYDVLMWVLIVHCLGWETRGPGGRPANFYHADLQTLRRPMHPSSDDLPDRLREQLLSTFGDEPEFDIGPVDEITREILACPPRDDYFRSILRDNVFRASRYALEFLLRHHLSGHESTPVIKTIARLSLEIDLTYYRIRRGSQSKVIGNNNTFRVINALALETDDPLQNAELLGAVWGNRNSGHGLTKEVSRARKELKHVGLDIKTRTGVGRMIVVLGA